jgi:hypothetical protein
MDCKGRLFLNNLDHEDFGRTDKVKAGVLIKDRYKRENHSKAAPGAKKGTKSVYRFSRPTQI